MRGTSQTTRFVGRALAESDALSTSLPLVGDQLAALSAVGDDLQLFATSVDDLYADIKENDEEFVAEINDTLANEVCGVLESAAPAGPSGCCSRTAVTSVSARQQMRPVPSRSGAHRNPRHQRRSVQGLQDPSVSPLAEGESPLLVAYLLSGSAASWRPAFESVAWGACPQ